MKVRFVVWKIISRLQNYCNHSFDVIMITMIPCLKVKFSFCEEKVRRKICVRISMATKPWTTLRELAFGRCGGKVWLQNIFGKCREGMSLVLKCEFWCILAGWSFLNIEFIVIYHSLSIYKLCFSINSIRKGSIGCWISPRSQEMRSEGRMAKADKEGQPWIIWLWPMWCLNPCLGRCGWWLKTVAGLELDSAKS